MVVTNSEGELRAAGGVVCRSTAGGGLEVMVVHRPRYDDWSFPKGKVEPGESDEGCALREVEEETGMRCDLEEELASIRYRDRFDRPKVVRYWRMAPAGGSFAPSDEVDAIEWLAPEAAACRLTYVRDIEVLNALAQSGQTRR